MHHRATATATISNGAAVNGHGGSSTNGSNGTNGQQKQPVTRRKRKVTNRNGHSSEDLQMYVFMFCMGIATLLMGIFIGTKLANSFYKVKRMAAHNDNRAPEDPDEISELPYNSHYVIPGTHPKVGDRSNQYIKLRKKYDEAHPKDPQRSLEFMQQLQRNSDYKYDTYPIPEPRGNEEEEYTPYDIYNCPDSPPHGYPYQWNALKVLGNWPTNDIEILPEGKRKIHQGLCVFDYARDYEKAVTYHQMEVPFVVKNDPDIAETVERWNSPGYMEELMGNVPHRTEYSENNQFLYSNPKAMEKYKKKHRKEGQKKNKFIIPENWKPPTEMSRMSYKEWLDHANTTAKNGDNDSTKKVAFDAPHWYYRLIGCGYMGNTGNCDHGSSEYLFDELPYFQPKENLLYMKDPHEQKGIHCRFGMDGVIAENHFDATRNTIIVFRGSRRYILGHPKSCDNFALYPMEHPNARHSQIDWSTQPHDKEELLKYPEFAKALVNEVILQAGDALYLPTYWFHYIVSLELNFQCNTRSGASFEYGDIIEKCGFVK